MGFLTGKRILVTGLASNRSIAYGIAKAMKEQGAELAFTYLNDKLQPRVEEFAKEFGSDIVLPLDVATDESIQNCFAELSKRWEKFDGFVHAIAFAPGDQLDGDYVNAATREGYRIAHDISAFSFVAMAQAARPYLNPNAALLTLSYLGAERAIPNYNVMGIAKAALEASVRYLARDMGSLGVRVNAISAGAMKTLAVTGIDNHSDLLKMSQERTTDGQSVTLEEIGGTCAFLMSDLSKGIAGDVIYVDKGVHLI